MIDFTSEAEFETYTKETNQKLIAFEGTIYEVSNYMVSHPGGVEKIEEHIGKVIDQAFEEAEHTQAARLIFRDLQKVGLLVGADPKEKTIQPKGVDGYKLLSKLNIDYTKPMFQQLVDANLQWDEYIQFINEPKHLVNPIRDVRLFQNEFMETLTKTPWWMIPMCFLPWVTFLILNHAWEQQASPIIMFIGFFSWTLAEYLLHRFFFHSEDYWLPNHPKVLVIHFFVHGIHHAFPQDRLRLVFPVALGYLIFYTAFVVPATMLMPHDIAYPFLAGLMLGYIAYDEVHYFLHHSSPKQGYLKDLKKYHMQHHYKNGTEGFGVSSKFWDYVFNTPIVAAA